MSYKVTKGRKEGREREGGEKKERNEERKDRLNIEGIGGEIRLTP